MKDESSIRILVVDDHPITRTGIAAILQSQPDMIACAQAGTVSDAVRLFAEHGPDLTLMDLRLPDGHGVEAIRLIRKKNPSAKIIVLTTYEGDEDIHQALQAGAMGYLIKGMSHDVLVKAIRRVYEGNRFLPPPVSQALSSRTSGSELSQREREVLSLIVAGNSNREIGEKLHIKEPTVKSHITLILIRLGVTDRTQAVVEALKRGLEHLQLKDAGHTRTPRISVGPSIFALINDQDRAYFGRAAQEEDMIGFLDETTRTVFGRSYAAEPDVLIEQLRKDEAIAEADRAPN